MQGDERDPSVLSPSALTECVRSRYIRWQHDYYVHPERRWKMGVGTAIHDWLDPQDGDSERRFETYVASGKGAVLLSGQLDRLVPVPGQPENVRRIIDIKTVGNFKYYDIYREKWSNLTKVKPTHEVQVNCYRLLAHNEGYTVNEASIWYVKRDSPEARLLPVTLWPLGTTLELVQRVAEVIAEVEATGELPPAFTPDEEEYKQCKWCEVRDICMRLAMEGK